MIDPKEAETMSPCPACEHCTTCRGTGKITCYRCPMPHQMDCHADTTCGLCEGSQMVTGPRRLDWLRINPTPKTETP